ncbi:MAG: hypothetical protein LBH58_06880 [Tannerellaceae bacterium]|jgi:hypothetical protein|nr:hypothetical protein [Tannerellaceae bacterium]
MSKLNSLIILVKSLSKAEKKALTLYSFQTEDRKLYLTLFNIIDKEKYANSKSIRKLFHKRFPNSSLSANIKYLFDLIIQIIIDLNIRKNKEYELYNLYLRTKVLRDRGLYNDYLSLTEETKTKAKDIGEYNLLLTLQREELKSDLLDHFDHIKKEEDLFKKQQAFNESLKIARQIGEQSYLYEVLRFKIEKQNPAAGDTLYAYKDLLVSEMNLVASLKNEIFEINRLHQLFQANYFISTGRYKSALNSYSELNKLYLANEKHWNNPPMYFVMVLEGILESLTRLRLFEEMGVYQNQLTALAQKYPYINFVLKVNAINFLYSVTPHMYNRNYKKCLALIDEYRKILIEKVLLLPPRLYLSIAIALSGIYLMNNELSIAQKILNPIISNGIYTNLKIFKSVQLLSLIIHYELGDMDYMEAIMRSIKYKNKKSNKESQIEKILFRYLAVEWLMHSKEVRELLKKEFRDEIMAIKYSPEEFQLIIFFDFAEWLRIRVE